MANRKYREIGKIYIDGMDYDGQTPTIYYGSVSRDDAAEMSDESMQREDFKGDLVDLMEGMRADIGRVPFHAWRQS